MSVGVTQRGLQLMASVRLSGVLYAMLLFCVFSWKMPLVGVGDAGIRPDDLLTVVVFVLLLVSGEAQRTRLSDAGRAYLMFVGVSLVSALWNARAERVELVYALFFVARLLQYMVFYYLGAALVRRGVDVWRGLGVYFGVLCVLVPLQSLGFVPVPGAFNASRASGNTNGPYELAVVAAAFLCHYAWRQREGAKSTLAGVLLLATASRITFAAALLSLSRRAVGARLLRWRSVVAVALLVGGLWMGGRWLMRNASQGSASDSDMASRLESSISLVGFQDAAVLYAAAPVYRNSAEYVNEAFLLAISYGRESESDVSAMIRAFRWSSLIKSTMAHGDAVVLGLGPSFGSTAVDGYFVRVFIETGLAGSAVFLLFLRRLLRGGEDGAFREWVLILIVTAVFIDIFASYKTMLLLWLWHGSNQAREARCE